MTMAVMGAPHRKGLFPKWRNRGIGTGAPAFLLILALFALPVFGFLFVGVQEGIGPLQRALTDGLYAKVLGDTLLLGVYVTLISFVLGYPLAYVLTIMPPRWAVIGFGFLLLPFWTSLLVRTYAWMVLLGRNGIINQALMGLGLIDTPLQLLNNLGGVLIGMVHVLLPYMVFPLYDVMRRINPALLQAADGLGASRFQAFYRIYFPLTLPGVLAGCILVFVLSIGFYITPALLGGGRVATMALMIERQVREFLDWEFAAALSLVLLATTLLVSLGLNRLLRSRL
ncbi:ABC transporter permease [Rhodoligotrophos ferricapiens]|uniref:ABC transporter permease n=1 Tax=Rhodoligotrophos ferricapiens TaxID=3069264 RepID=UPI00315CBC1A